MTHEMKNLRAPYGEGAPTTIFCAMMGFALGDPCVAVL